jgi:hypothetical protein
VWICTKKEILGVHALGTKGVIFGGLIWVITLLLGVKSLGAVFGWF